MTAAHNSSTCPSFDGFPSRVYNRLAVGGSAPPICALLRPNRNLVGLLELVFSKKNRRLNSKFRMGLELEPRPTLGGSLTAMTCLTTLRPRMAACLIVGLQIVAGSATAQAPARPDANPGQFFTITEPITNETIERIRAATRQLVDQQAGEAKGKSPILVFEFLPGEFAPGTSRIGTSFDLANLISKELGGARLTVAYVPQPLTGYAVLPALACSEIVMGAGASLGPITPDNQTVDPAFREPVRFLALRKTRDPDLLLGMLDRDADLRLVRTADKALHYILAENLAEFRKANQVTDEQAAWEGGQRGVLTARRARAEGFCKAIAENSADVAHIYQISGQSAVEDPTLGHPLRPIWIKITGPLDSVKVGYLSRRIDQARQEKVNIIFFQIDSPGGLDSAADSIADQIATITDMKTVAYIDERALGVAALVPLACRDIVFKKSGRMGEIRQIIVGRNNRLQDLSDAQVQVLTKKAAFLAGKKGHPEAVARAMVDPDTTIVEVRDLQTGATRFLLSEEAEAEPRTIPGQRGAQETRTHSFPHRRRGGFVRHGSGREQRRGPQRLVWTARQAHPGRRSRMGRLAGHNPDRSRT